MVSDASRDAELLALLDRFADAWNRHDLDALMSMMTDDCMFEASLGPDVDGRRSKGRSTVGAAFAAVFDTLPETNRANPRYFIAGSRGVSEWTFRGYAAGWQTRRRERLRCLHVRSGDNRDHQLVWLGGAEPVHRCFELGQQLPPAARLRSEARTFLASLQCSRSARTNRL